MLATTISQKVEKHFFQKQTTSRAFARWTQGLSSAVKNTDLHGDDLIVTVLEREVSQAGGLCESSSSSLDLFLVEI